MTNVMGYGLKKGQTRGNGKGKNVMFTKSKAPKKDTLKFVCKNMASKMYALNSHFPIQN